MSMDKIEQLSYEQAYSRLEFVIAKLESGELSLEDSINLYEEGRKLSARCQSLLEQAELRVQQLDDDGELSNI